MTRRIKIGSQWIGEGEPCFILAEAGSNHNGSLDEARRLIEVAQSAGADGVKFQLFRASRLYPKTAGLCDYLKLPEPIYDLIAKMELPYEWLPILSKECRHRGILFLASVFDEECVDRLDPYVEAFKIASYEMTHTPLVTYVAKKGKPLILSTGTASLEEVSLAVEVIRRTGNEQLALMQCTAAYPAPPESLNVRAIATLKSAFGVPVGLSDHSRDPFVGPLSAVALGADLLEKHFTLDNDLPGPDHRFAVEPEELRQMIEKVRSVEKALGSGKKKRHPVEEELYDFARRCLFATRPIKRGENFTVENVAVLRKGKKPAGLAPIVWETVLRSKAARDISPEEPIRQDDVARGYC